MLELAHMVDDNPNSSNSLSNTPSRERLMEKLIVKPSDLIMVNVTNVDLDYAVKGKNLKQFSTLSILEASRVLVVSSFWKKKNNNKKQTDQNVREQPRG